MKRVYIIKMLEKWIYNIFLKDPLSASLPLCVWWFGFEWACAFVCLWIVMQLRNLCSSFSSISYLRIDKPYLLPALFHRRLCLRQFHTRWSTKRWSNRYNPTITTEACRFKCILKSRYWAYIPALTFQELSVPQYQYLPERAEQMSDQIGFTRWKKNKLNLKNKQKATWKVYW